VPGTPSGDEEYDDGSEYVTAAPFEKGGWRSRGVEVASVIRLEDAEAVNRAEVRAEVGSR